MIVDFLAADAPDSFDCDVLIVGAGAVGIPMAVDLSRRGIDVILIEGGGTGLETTAQALNEASVSGMAMTGLQNARFRLLGGSTNFWGGQIVRFDPIIFEPRPWAQSPGWPFRRADLDPYYDKSARLLGLQDDFSDADLWAKVASSPPDLGPDLEIFLTRCLLNRSTAHVFKSDLDGDVFRTLIHANVTALAGDAAGSRIAGVQLRALSGKEGQVRAKRVVLTCGTIEITRLLLHPLADGRTPPWADNSWVGRGFIDHIEATGAKVTLRDKKRFHDVFDNLYIDRVKYFPRIKLSAEGQRSTESLDVAGRFEFRSHYKEHLANLKLFARSLMNGQRPDDLSKLPAHLAAVWRVALPLAVRYLKSNRAFNPADAGIDLMLMSEQWPTRESRISLTGEKTALGTAKIDVSWTIDGRELDTMAVFAERVKTTFESLGLIDMTIDPLLAARDPRFMTTVQDYYHQMGGARMGASAQDGVVDSNMKVFGSDNLYVGGAAVYPFSGFGNPTYTAMALGMRLSDHLVGQHS
jgi:choline dehydrogenase-like flavoprotein